MAERKCNFTGGQCVRPSCQREDECRAEVVIATGNALIQSWRDKAIAHGYTDEYVEREHAADDVRASQPTLICPRCKADRFLQACPNAFPPDCPMLAQAQGNDGVGTSFEGQ